MIRGRSSPVRTSSPAPQANSPSPTTIWAASGGILSDWNDRVISRPVYLPTPFSPIKQLPPARKQPIRREPRAVAQACKLGPDHVLGNAAPAGRGIEAAIGPRQHPRRIADDCGDALDAVGHDLRMLDEIRQAVDDARHQHLIVLERMSGKTAKFVGMPRIGEGQDEAADIGLLQS